MNIKNSDQHYIARNERSEGDQGIAILFHAY